MYGIHGATTYWIDVNPTATTTYNVTVTDGKGCQASTSVTVTVNPLPTPSITGDTEICTGASTTLIASGGTAYVWNNGATEASITVSPTATTTYNVTVTDGNGCQASTSVTVTVHPLPTSQVSVATQKYVHEATTRLTASGGTGYLWSTGATTYWIDVSPTGATTTYNVTVTDGNGCHASASVTVTVNPLPTPNITGDTEICTGSSTSLTASGGTTYVWSNGAASSSITVSPTTTTTYNVTVTDGKGCQASTSVTVTVNPLPTITISGDTEICAGECTTLTATGGATYEWGNVGSNGYECNGAFFVGGLQGGEPQNLYNMTGTQLREIGPLGTNNVNGIAYYCQANSTPHIYGMRMKGNSITDATRADLVQIDPRTGATVILGEIPQPPNPYGLTGTTGIMGYIGEATRGGKYYFPAVSALINPVTFAIIDYSIYLGEIDLNNHGNGGNVVYRAISILPTCRPYMDACVAAFQQYALNPGSREPSGGIQDWALSEDEQTLYSFFGIENALFRLNLGTMTTNCVAGPISNGIYTGQTGVQTDEFGGIYFENNELMGYQVDRGRVMRIDQNDGTLTLVSSDYPRDYRGDNAICRDCGMTTGPNNEAEITVCPDETTTYTVTVTDENGCSSSKEVTVTVHPLPTAVIIGDTEICIGSSTSLTASGGTSYVWSNGATGASITVSPTATTTYNVTVTDVNGCDGTASKTVIVNPLPAVSIFGIDEICNGGNTTLFASGGVSYIWSNGATSTSIAVSPTATTTYNVTVTDGNGCQASTSVTVTVHPLPTASISGDTEICTGTTTRLTASGGTGYLWSTGATTYWIDVNPTATTTYNVTVTDGNGCQASTSVTVNVNPLPTASISGDTEICTGTTTRLTASGGTGYLWSTGATTYWIDVNPTATTTYNVTVTNGNGCQASTSVTVNVNPLPTPSISGDTEICTNANTTLTASGGTTYLWSNGATSTSITVSPTATTTYNVTVTDGNGCQASTSVTVTVHPLPTPSISGDTEICTGTTTRLTASGGTTYVWSNGATEASITVSPTATTTYNVTVTDGNGCQASTSVTVNVNPLPTTSISGDTEICTGTTTRLTASGGTGYLWSTGATTNWIDVNPTTTTTYNVTVTNGNGCQASTSVTVKVNPLPSPSIAGDTEICTNASTTLTASGGTTYLWSNGATSTSITVSPTATTTYNVTVTDGNGCQASTSVTVTVNPLPTPSITGDTEICTGASTTLTASGGTAYVWSNGATAASITVNPTATTTYNVTVSNSNDCQASTSVTVTVHPLPTPSISGDIEICTGASTTLTASGGTAYVWNNGATEASITVSPTATTTYNVTVTDGNGCQASTSVAVTVNPLPTPSITGDTEICNGATTRLTASGGTSYTWSTGATTYWIDVNPTATTTYNVTVTDTKGCQASAIVTVTVNPLPTPSITGDTEICTGASTTLIASGGTAYVWNNGATEASITVSPTATTTYNVTVTDGNGCQASTSVTVTVHPLPIASISGDTEICNEATTRLTASGGTGYLWSTGATTYWIDVSPTATTTYNVTVTDGNGCHASASVTVTVNPLPTPNITGDTEICTGSSTSLTASGGTTYVWSNGAASSSITVSPTTTTTYNVTVTDGKGCQASTSVTVTVNPLPTITISGDTEICAGECTTLTATGGATYEWGNVGSNGYECNGAFFVGGLQGGEPQNLYNMTGTQLREIGPLGTNNVNGIAYYCQANSTPHIYGMRMKGNSITDATRADLVQIDPRTGATVILGEIPQPPNPYGLTGTTGIMGYIGEATRGGKYYFPAVSALINPVTFAIIDYSIYLGEIDLNNHGNGGNVVYRAISILPTCRPYMDACVAAFQQYALNPGSREPSGGIQDWALSEDEQTLYSFFGIENALFRLNLGTMTTNCVAGPISNGIYTGQTGVQTDEFGGIYFENNELMGYQVDRGRVMRIDQNDGTLTLVSSDYPRDYRGDNAICRDCGMTTGPNNEAEITVCPDETTTYTVTVTDENGCSSSKEVTVTVHPLPTAVIIGDTEICIGSSTSLTASGGTSYVWSNGATGASITVSPTATTTYNVTVTDVNGCDGTASKTVIVNPLPAVSIFGIDEICNGGNTTLFASGGVSYIWSNGATSTSIAVSPTATTTYNVTVTDGNGCQASTSVTVTVHPLPTASISGDTEICTGTTTRLTASGGTGYLWSTGATTYWIDVNPTATTTYNVTVTDGNGCQASTSVTVNVNPLPTASISGDTEICTGTTTRLTASGGTGYLWSTGATTYWIDVNPTATTTYNVTVTNGNGCQASTSVIVNVNPLPSPSIAGDTEICTIASTTLTASGGTTYVWSNGATSTSITVSPTATTTYNVTVTDGNGCQASTSVTVTVHPLPTPSISGDTEICTGTTTRLTASGGTGYLWSTGATTYWIDVNPTATTTYNVTVTDGNGCQASTIVTVTVNPLPTTSITGDTEICTGTTTRLTASGGTGYLWSTGATTYWIDVNPTATTTYNVTVTNGNGCQASTSVTVKVNPLPSPSIAGDTEICTGASTTLTASGGTTYLWSNGATSTSITVSPTATTTYNVTVTDGNGCQASTSVTVTVNPLPTPSITGDTEICTGASTTLTASGGTAYVWSNGATAASITVNPTATTTYNVTVSNSNDCQASTSVTVTVHPLPVVSISGENKICSSSTASLTATGGGSYLWSNGSTTASISVSPTANTTYTVTVTNSNTCTNTASHTIMVKPKPEVILSGPDRLCSGDKTFIVVNGHSENECPGSCNVDQPEVLAYWDLEACHSVMALGTHMDYSEFVPVVNNYNCTQVTAGNVHRLNQNKHSCTPGFDGNVGMCIGAQITCNPSKLDYTKALRFEVTLTPSQNGQITGLSFYEQSPLNFQFIDGISALNDFATKYLIRISKNGNVIYYVDEIATNRTWGKEEFDFSNNPLFSSSSLSTYLFELIPYCNINNGGRESIWDIDDIKVLGGCCAGNTEQMTYAWSNGQTGSSIMVTPSTTASYSVTVTDCCGCSNVAQHTVRVSTIKADLGPDRMINLGQSLTLTPTITGEGICDPTDPSANQIKYLWNIGETTSSIVVTPTASDFYRVTVTDCFECVDTESITIHINMTSPMTLFPNPSSGVINIVSQTDLDPETSLKLLAINGMQVMINDIEIIKHNARNISGNISQDIPNGIYILEVKNGDQTIRQKLIIHNK
jgi:predicted transcriptional regulator